MNGFLDPAMIAAILPEISLVVLAGLVLVLDLAWRGRRQRDIGRLTLGGLLLAAGLALVYTRPLPGDALIWGGMLRLDMGAYVFRLIFLFGAALTVLFSLDGETTARASEYYLLLVISTLGMSLMASAADLVMLYLAIETTSIPLYVLAGSLVRDQKSVESGIKYLLFGAMTSAVMLYGFSLLYGFTGTTQLYQLAGLLQTSGLPLFSLLGVLMLVLVGFAFKISAVPFQFWAPDVYEGAPTPVAGFLSTASKGAGFAVLIRFLLAVYPGLAASGLLVAVISTASMFFGNLLALRQSNIKRLLAYSSIAQAGYMLIGVAAGSDLGNTATIYYLMAYLVTNLAAFGIVVVVGRSLGSDEISAYAGLSRRSPGLGLALMAALLSLGGIPPFAGFIGKLFVFAAAMQSGWVWLAAVGVINSVIALYYYLTVIKVIWLYRSERDEQPMRLTRAWRVALVVCVAGMILLGTLIAPWYQWAAQASAAF